MSEPERGSFLRALGLRRAPAPDGVDVVFELDLDRSLLNSRDGLQGGLVATLIDIAAGFAALQGTAGDKSTATSNLTVHYLSAVTVGPARAEATRLRSGRTSVVVDVKVYDVGRDKLAATSTVAFAVLELRPGQSEPGRTPPHLLS